MVKQTKFIAWVGVLVLLGGLLSSQPVSAATLLSDSFAGTTIDVSKWTEVDTAGSGGGAGNVQQNGSAIIGSSYNGSTWGGNAWVSANTYGSTNLEVAATVTKNSDFLIGYGDYNFNAPGTKAYMLDLAGSVVYTLVWDNNGVAASNFSCGSYTAGATYSLKVVSGGFEAYKNGVLMCTQSTSVVINNKPVFFQAAGSASAFDDALVTGNAVASAPDAPSGLAASPGNAQVGLTWTAPNANGSAITDYTIEYKLSSEPTTWTTFSDGTSTTAAATVTGLTNSSAYDFRVKAVNGIGVSAASGTATATPTVPTVPAAPTIGTAIAGNTSASVSFIPGSSGGSAITGYTVTSSPGGLTGTGSSSPITVTGLTNGVAYTFTVTATNGVGTSSASSASNSVTPNVEVPTSIGTISLWLDGSDVNNITQTSGSITQVNDKSGNNKNSTASGSVSPTLVSNVQNGRSVMRFDGANDYLNINSAVTYRTVAVVAKYGGGTTFADYNGIIGDFTGSSPSNGHILNGVVGTGKLATATNNFSSAYKNGSIISGSSGHDFSPINQFWIGVFTLPSGATNTTSAIGMINGGGRYWNGDIAEVIAYSSTLTTTERQTLENYLSVKWGIAVSGPSVPGAPTGLAAARGNGQVSLSWTAPASDGGSSITDYIIQYKLSSEPTTWTTFTDGTSTSTATTVTGLTNGNSYDFRVSAVNFIGTGSVGGTVTKTPGPAIAPDPPTGVTAVEGNTQVAVSFTAPADNGGSAITGYTVTSSPGGLTGTGSSSPITVTGLTNGVAYTFTVTATNGVGTSSASSASNSVIPSTLGNQLTDSFGGTTINTTKWYELDPAGAGGSSGKIQQNGSLTIADSYSGGTWANTALVSQDVFDAASLEISASMTAGSSPLIGYGDYQFDSANKKAYLLYITASGSQILALSWNNVGSSSTDCGTANVGAATYKMKIVSGGFEVYKNNVLLCTHTTGVAITSGRVFLQNASSASTFDDVVVYGSLVTHGVPNAPTIGSATAGNSSATVSFTPPNFNNGSAITGYTVTSSPGGLTGTGSSSPITVTGLTNGVAYTFTVTATNGVGTSSASSASNSVTPSLPPAPGQVTGLVATGFNQQVLLGWYAPVSGGTPTDYLVEYKLSTESAVWTTFADGVSTALKTIVTGLVNGSSYDFRVTALNDGNPGTVSALATASPDEISTLAFVITGESNSGGIGLNSDATVGELASRPAVQIMNLTSGSFLFENLDIGTNNLRDHAGLEGYYDSSHGFELQLANSTEANAFPDNSQVYLLKTGHGGSQVSQWDVGQTYWTKFLQRTAAAKTQLPANRKWVVWMSLGINDAIGGTPTNTWKTAMVAHINKIKADLPGAIIILTEFQSMTAGSGYPTYNAVMDQIAAEEPNVYVVDSTGAGLRDGNHWSYAGLKAVASSMVTVTKNVLGLNAPGKPTGLVATPSGTTVSLSWTAPVANGGAAITDYVVQYKLQSANIWTTFNDGISTVTSATITGLSSATAYNVRVSAKNSGATGNSVSATATTTDTIAPVVSGVSVNVGVGNTTAGITWTTDEAGSSIVEYGLSSAYGASTSEADTAPRVTSHTVSLSGLLPCGFYYFRVKSNDAANNLGVGAGGTFSTQGCTAAVTSQTGSAISNLAGGSVQHNVGPRSLTLAIPAGAAGADATFQIKQIDAAGVATAIGQPSGVVLSGAHTYELKAFSGVGSAVGTFNNPISVSIAYTDSDVVGVDESTLRIYRYSSGEWSQLSNCSVNSAANTVTCTTIGFSAFGLFGSASVAATSVGDGGALPVSFYNTPQIPQGGFMLIVQGGAQVTASPIVSVVVNALSDVTSIALSRSPDFAQSVQVPYVPGMAWSLCPQVNSCTAGRYNIYAKVYTFSGQSSAVFSSSVLYSPSTSAVGGLNSIAPVSKTVFTRSLKTGTSHGEVKALQQFLNARGFTVARKGPGASGKETTIFGNGTRAALRKYQDKFLKPKMAARQFRQEYGVVGPATRALLNEHLESPR